MDRRRLGVALLVALACSLIASGCRPGEVREAPVDVRPERIRIAISEECLSALVLLARENGAFERHGLDVEVVPYSSSTLAMQALRSGDVEAATAADVPVVIATLEGDVPQIIATIGRSQDDVRIVARRDRGISEPADLVGKSICTREETAAEFFLHTFLARHGLDESELELVIDTFEAAVSGVAEGVWDAAALRSPHLDRLTEELGPNGIVFSEPGLYVKTMNLCVADSLEHDTRVRLLKALVDAEHPKDPEMLPRWRQELSETLADEIDLLCDAQVTDEFLVRLDQSLLLSLEDAARWIISERGDADMEVPDFLDQLDLAPLDEVDPDRISVIR